MSHHDNWKRPYSATETREEALIRMYESGGSWIKRPDGRRGYVNGFLEILAKEFDTTSMAINKKLGRLRRDGRIGWARQFDGDIKSAPGFTPLVTADKKIPDSGCTEEFLDLVISGTKAIAKRDVRQEEVYPKYNHDGWTGLVIGGDWHFEHYKTDTKALIEDLKLIGKEPNLLFGFNGDSVDVIDLRFLELENETMSIPTRRLYEVVEYLFSLVPNTLFMVMGCHDNWVRTRARWDILEAIQEKIPGYYLGFGGTVNLKLGNVVYRIVAYHKYGFEAKANIFHPCSNYLNQMDSNADIVAIAHRHDLVGVAYAYIQGRPRVFMRSGSHQYKTDYAWKEGFKGAIARWPLVLLNGTSKRMIPVTNFREGIPILRMLNKYPEFEKGLLKAGKEETNRTARIVRG
jgi:hypothetical protein